MNKILKTASFILLIAAITGVCLVFLLDAPSDNDFFWHLKSGELIWQNKSLPSQDPFSFTSQGHANPQEQIILTSYWLSQIIFYLFYFVGGVSGIVFMKFLILGAMIYVMLVLRKGDRLLYTGLLLITLLITLTLYLFDRPQIFSFLFFGLLLYLLSIIRNEKLLSGFAAFVSMSLLMVVWANMHSGFILGQLTIILYIILEGAKFAHRSLQPISKKAYVRLVIAGILGIAFSLANPNTYHVLTFALGPHSSVAQYVNEYLSSFEFLFLRNNYLILLFWFIMALTIVAVAIKIKRPDITEVALLAGLGYFSFTNVRYILFFLIAALPAASLHLSNVKLMPVFRGGILATALFSSVFFTRNMQIDFRNVFSDQSISSVYPVAASEFVLCQDLKGNMYNFYDWGGYLIWRLSPKRKVFVDGRIINQKIYLISRDINGAHEADFSGLPRWKAVFEAYRIKYAILPFSYQTGELLPLAYTLTKDKEWIAIFISGNSIIYVKDVPENSQVIQQYAIPKDSLVKAVLMEFGLIIQQQPWNVPAHITVGELYLMEGNFNESKKAYKKALYLAPFNHIAQERLHLISSLEQLTGNKHFVPPANSEKLR